MSFTDAFQMLLEASWQGSLVIVLILLLRPLLGLRVPARWRHLLWMLVLLRLLVPAFVLPRSPTSLQNLTVVSRPLEQTGTTFDRASTAPEGRGGEAPVAGAASPVAPKTARPRWASWRETMAGLWLAGAALAGLWILAGTVMLHRRLRRDAGEVDEAIRAVWERCCQRVISTGGEEENSHEKAQRRKGGMAPLRPFAALRLCARFHPPRLRQTGAVSSPALVGVWRPVLLIPRQGCETLSAEDWEHVFLHELAHFRRGDHWLHALQLLALCAHWFNPLVWFGFRYLRADRELAADEWALRHLEDRRPVAYGDTLLKVLSAQAHRGLTPGLVGIMEDGAQMKQRLRHIVAFTPRRSAGSVAGMALVAGLAAIILTAAQAQVSALSGWSVIRLAIPKDGEIQDAYVDLRSPSGRLVTLTESVKSTEGVSLEKVEWVGSPVRARVTLRKGEEKAELFANAALVSKRDDFSRVLPQVEIEVKFIEMPDDVVDSLKLPASESFMDRFPDTHPRVPHSHGSHLRGMLTEQEAEQFLMKLNTKKGVDLLSAPRVTTRSGQRAVVEIIREFRYPSEWNPPDAKEPRWIPKEFETRNTGVTLEVDATLREGQIIDLKATPQVVEFLGFVDFETRQPVFAAKPDPTKSALDRMSAFTSDFKPTNRPFRPIFSTRKSTTMLSMNPGQTVALAGLSETEDPSPFPPPNAGRQLIVLIRATTVKPQNSPSSPTQDPAPSPTPDSGATSVIPVATAVVGKPGFVTSPHAPNAGYVDVRGVAPGTEVKCPYTGKTFWMP